MIECVTKLQKRWYLLNEIDRQGEVNCTTWLSVTKLYGLGNDAICGKSGEKKQNNFWSKTHFLSNN